MCKNNNDKKWTIEGQPIDPKEIRIGMTKPDYSSNLIPNINSTIQYGYDFIKNLVSIISSVDFTDDEKHHARCCLNDIMKYRDIIQDAPYNNDIESSNTLVRNRNPCITEPADFKLKKYCTHIDLISNTLADNGNGICYICERKIHDIDRIKYKLSNDQELTDEENKVLNTFLGIDADPNQGVDIDGDIYNRGMMMPRTNDGELVEVIPNNSSLLRRLFSDEEIEKMSTDDNK